MASAELAEIVRQLRAQPLSAAPTLLQMREDYEAMAPPPPEGTRSALATIRGVEVEWVRAGSVETDRTVLFLHGGGYTMGSIRTHRALAARLSAAAGARVVLVGYRLAPEAPFPAALDDAVAVHRQLVTDLSPARLAVLGDSAGAGLGLATLASIDPPHPVACVCLSPWVDLALTAPSLQERAERDPLVTRASLEAMAAAYLQDTDPREPLASPLYGNLAGLPPMLIQVGTDEILFDDATRLADAARRAGVEVTLEPWDDVFHVWHAFAGALPEADRAVQRVGEYLRAAFARGSGSEESPR